MLEKPETPHIPKESLIVESFKDEGRPHNSIEGLRILLKNLIQVGLKQEKR